ncbi:UDP-2,4-diacetamido-2,4,6-trideoxy-beta-L-altropyranose hydrolase [uncultured Prochlorococcus sp.]|uniref:UDP-2,4-diacetamido-2,4, 6-trideoxy-beta-L-altropyranose hydrolase n=1 Tax=uncultured Prochlorococcus sp. TaxID=159733 RepID=UPI0025843DE0|nr:UDP-2,4-diacetamido-2,4,6-trideoxy-beta-L-altropyranose hydrolase [uncultured Prochlorococcus sp.]
MHWLGCNQKEDAEDTIKILKENNIKLSYLIIDHYGIDEEWENFLIKKYLNQNEFKVVVIDDLYNRNHICDYIIDQNIIEKNNNPYLIKTSSKTNFILGPYFAILSKEYIQKKNFIKNKISVKRILIFFSGVDKNNLTYKLANILKDKKFNNLFIDIVVGRKNQKLSDIKKIISGRKNFKLHIQIKTLSHLMGKADLAIGGGGINSWERECMKLPTLLISLRTHQIDLSHSLNKKGKVNYLGHFNEVDDETISKSLINEIGNFKTNKKKGIFVDGLGAKRILVLLNGLNLPFKLKKISKFDMPLLRFWLDEFTDLKSIGNILSSNNGESFLVKNSDNCPIYLMSFDYQSIDNLEIQILFDSYLVSENKIKFILNYSLQKVISKRNKFKVIKISMINNLDKKNSRELFLYFSRLNFTLYGKNTFLNKNCNYHQIKNSLKAS